MQALLTEKRSVEIDPPTWLQFWCDKVRLGPTVAGFLDRHRPGSRTKGDQLVLGALKVELTALIITERFDLAYDELGGMLGRHPHLGGAPPDEGERKPLARARR